jgi:rhodanese-related sulfurtransferase
VPEGSAASNPALITVEELNTMLEDKDFTFVNVHIPYDGEIAGTDVHIPYNEVEDYANQLPQDKEAKIVLYCRSGPMSAAASKTLVEMGYTNVIDVEGGMKAWQAAGFELLYQSK